MDIKDLQPARDFAKIYGCKAIVFGPSGRSKTPSVNTCPRPVLLACEPGLMSMKGSNVPTWIGNTGPRVDEFFKWFFHSNEPKAFDTLAIDSGTQMCDVYLQEALKTNKHGKAAYGEMATNVMNQLRPLFFMQQKHAYIICKEETTEHGLRRPYFLGQQLPKDAPGLYDFLIQLDIQNVPGMPPNTLAYRCNGDYSIVARNRTGNLNDYEEPNFTKLTEKAMQ